MIKQILFTILAVITTTSCVDQKISKNSIQKETKDYIKNAFKSETTSNIRNAIAAETTAEAYGDGTYTVLPWVLPLSDQALASFDSPLKKVGFIAGGFARMFMNIGASLGMGKMQLTLIQPIPELPNEYLKEIRIKRIFFYIEPKEELSEEPWFKKPFNKKAKVDFGFIDKIAIKLSPQTIENNSSWTPIVSTHEMSKNEFSYLKSLFVHGYREPKYEESKEITLMKYEDEDSQRFLKNSPGKTYILTAASAGRMGQARIFFIEHPKLRGAFKSTHLLNQTLLLELNANPDFEENFEEVLAEEKDRIHRLGVQLVQTCQPKTCLDFNVPKANLYPFITRSSGIKLDAYIEADKVPDSFQLKGYIEFETKLKLSF